MKKINLFVVVILLSVPKFFFLDQDAPSYMISGISQEDEAYYCIGGVNRFLVDEGRIHPQYQNDSGELLQVANTHLTYLSLSLFGNNYYGLRIPVVLISILINILLVFFAHKRGLSTKWLLLLAIFLSTEFYSFLFGRFYNPQVFSMFFITMILLLVFSGNCNEKLISFIIGFLCGFMILGVYIYTLYFALAIYLWYFFMAIKEKKSKSFVFIVLGGLSSVLVWVMYILMFDINYNELLNNLLIHGGGAEVEVSVNAISLIKRVAIAFLEIVATNFFRYNLFLIGLFIALIFYCMKYIKIEKYASLFLIVIIMLVFQNFFIHSYPFKKHITLYPIIVLFTIFYYKNIVEWLLFNTSKFALLVCFFLSLCFIYYNYKLNNSENYWAGFNYGYYENISSWISKSGLAIALAFIIFFFGYKYFEKFKLRVGLLLLICFLPSLYLTGEQFFWKKTFFSKNALTEMKSEISGKYLVQDFSHAFQFYSNSKPVLSNYNRPEFAKINMDSLYTATNGYAILKLFRNTKNDIRFVEERNAEVVMNGLKFCFLKKYPLRYYDYYLIKFINN